MLKRLIAACATLVIATPVLAQTVVPHVTGNVTGWRGGNNHDASATYGWMDAWPNNGSWGGWQDATLAQFDRAALQSAINNMIDVAGGWDAKVIVTQPSWSSSANPATSLPGLQPVVGSAQVDAAMINWTAAQSFTAGLGAWMLNGTTYGTFGEAVLAGVSTGKSVVYDVIPWTTEGGPTQWDVVMNPPENMIVQYMKNTSATGIFASAKTPYTAPLVIYTNQNTGSDIRVRIDAPPAGASWINAVIAGDTHALWLNRTIVAGSSPVTVPVQVNNAGSGSLAWTAAVSPSVAWLSLTSANGGNGATFQMVFNVSGVAAGTYSTSVVITDNSSGNKTVTIPVTLTVQSASPVIQLAPTSLTFQGSPTGANPAPQTVTVNNVGSGTLNWTAAKSATSWITSFTTSGTNGSSLSVSVSQAGLTANVYTGTITVTDANAQNSPQTLTITLLVQDQDADITKANSYDDAWETGANGWTAEMWHLKLNATGKNTGFCVFLGDSITYSSAFGAWARSVGNSSAGMTAADTATCNWTHANTGSSQTTNDGWFLAKYDVPNRNGSYTARSGITAGGYLTGYAAPDLPGMDKMFTLGYINPDGKQYRDAQMAVILLGTNDIGGGDTAGLTANLGAIVDKLVAAKIIPILTTLPPRTGSDATVANFNAAIRTLATTRKIPLIDFWTEMTRRRPGTTWQNTLMGSDGLHPSGDRAGFTVSSNPYANNGQALSEVGYLLRSWLTVQKIAEVKAKVLDKRMGDINGDGQSDMSDLLLMASSWGLSKGNPGYDQRCDLNGDNDVDVVDLLILADTFMTF
jgi:hypothetical protein